MNGAELAENHDQCVLQFVGFLDEVDRQVLDDLEGLVFVEPVFGDQAAEEGAVDAAGYVVASGMERKARVSSLKPTVL